LFSGSLHRKETPMIGRERREKWERTRPHVGVGLLQRLDQTSCQRRVAPPTVKLLHRGSWIRDHWEL
jgi:hypothetical protein